MPVIKSSSNGVDITVIVFDKREIDALVELLTNANFQATAQNRAYAEILEDMFYALNIPYPPDFK